MNHVPITLTEQHGITREKEPIRMGVPFARGAVFELERLQLQDQDGSTIPADYRVTATWADGSIKWCLLDFTVSMAPRSTRKLVLVSGDSQAVTPAPLTVTPASDRTILQNGDNSYTITGAADGSLRIEHSSGASAELPPITVASGTVRPLGWTLQNAASTAARSATTIQHRAQFLAASLNTPINVDSAITIFAASGTIRWDITLHNPNAAQHRDGLWDLGDEGSLQIKECQLRVTPSADSRFAVQAEADAEWQTCTTLDLSQVSSGGNNWHSRNHVNHENEVRLPYQGYSLSFDAQSHQGLRANPIIFAKSGVSVCIKDFWQNFPKNISAGNRAISIGLFPEHEGSTHELQGGERKTHTIYLNFSDNQTALQWTRFPLNPQIAPEYLASTDALTYFSGLHEPVDALIKTGLDPQQGFLAKRELIDEFGWRNFGDVFADHESLYLPEGQQFVSHYNNQYDPLYGFLRQYLHDGNSQWLALAENLARHITDIDIYHTQNDRPEYNGGLFWHTDHYVDAFTSSHRTYSRHQKPDGIHVTGGGGPGGQHCYTHGLLLHYFLTGNEHSRDAVLQLTEWIRHVYDGTGSTLEQLVKIKKDILPKMKAAARNGKTLHYQYPLDRGTGNYINALLDSFIATNDTHYLTHAEHVIRNTAGPGDDILDRHFDDVEGTWFYTVFLQSVLRYLSVKSEFSDQTDEAFIHARETLLHYARWIALHEAPYLEHPEKLEYPNDTWTAQDIRKACILYGASSYALQPAERELWRQKADSLYEYTYNRLMRSPERHFSRILAILMQNHGIKPYFEHRENGSGAPTSQSHQTPYVTAPQLLGRTIMLMIRTVFSFSLERELRWLKFRNARFEKIYNKLFGTK